MIIYDLLVYEDNQQKYIYETKILEAATHI